MTGAPRNPLVDVDACWQAELTRSLPGGCHSEVHGLDDGAQAAKPAAIGCYRTQVPALLALNARLAEPGTLSYEVTWRPR